MGTVENLITCELFMQRLSLADTFSYKNGPQEYFDDLKTDASLAGDLMEQGFQNFNYCQRLHDLQKL